jgi:Overcoming lysogenization defect protein-like, TOPRIM domain
VSLTGSLARVNASVLVEGESDRAALETLAKRRGRDLAAEGVTVISMGGASLVKDFIRDAVDSSVPIPVLAGLCDAAEADLFRVALESAGLGSDLSIADMESLGFFVCVSDLEDELIRSLPAGAIEAILTGQGELQAFETFQNQPHWRGRPLDEQFHRFAGIRSGRKVRYGRVLVEALDLAHVPRPLDGVLAFV